MFLWRCLLCLTRWVLTFKSVDEIIKCDHLNEEEVKLHSLTIFELDGKPNVRLSFSFYFLDYTAIIIMFNSIHCKLRSALMNG